MSKKLGNLIKEARTAKGLTQAALAEQVDGLTASDVSKVERGEKEPTQDVIKKMAKVLGVTQKSLLDEVTGTGKTAAAGKTSSTGKTASSGKTTSSGKTAAAGKTSSAAKKPSSAKKTSSSKTVGALTLTATEKKLVQLYRKADATTKKAAINLLEGDASVVELVAALMAAKGSSSGSSGNSGTSDLLSSLLSGKTGNSTGSGKDSEGLGALMDVLGNMKK